MSYRKHTLLASTQCQERDSEKEKETKQTMISQHVKSCFKRLLLFQPFFLTCLLKIYDL